MDNIFEKASRLKIRFSTARGLLSTEDLWRLPLTGTVSLDSIAIDLDQQIKATATTSFVNTEKKPDVELQVAFEIVKHVIKVRQTENEARNNAALRRARKQRLLEVLEDKQNKALSDKSVEDLQREIAEIDASEAGAEEVAA